MQLCTRFIIAGVMLVSTGIHCGSGAADDRSLNGQANSSPGNQNSFTGFEFASTSRSLITENQARTNHRTYLGTPLEMYVLSSMKKIRGFFIPKKDLDYIFKSPDYANLAGARIYLGLNKGQYCLMMVGVKSDLSNDFPNGIIDEFYPCPTQCPGDDGSLPAAIRQTDLNYNAGIWDQANFGNISPLHIVSFHEIFSLITEGDARKYHLDYLDAPLEIYDAGSSTMNKIRGFFIEKKDLDVIKNNPGYSNLHGARLYMGLLGKQYTLMMVAVKQDNSNDFVNGIIGGFSVSNGRFPGDVSSLSLAVRQSDLNYDAPNGTWKQPK